MDEVERLAIQADEQAKKLAETIARVRAVADSFIDVPSYCQMPGCHEVLTLEEWVLTQVEGEGLLYICPPCLNRLIGYELSGYALEAEEEQI